MIAIRGIDSTDSLASTAATATATGLDAVLLEVGIIGMARPRVEVGLGIVVRALIFVLDKETNGCAQGDAMFDTRLDVDEILLVSLYNMDVSPDHRR